MPIYLDHQSTTPVDSRVLQQMLPYFCESFGNASSLNHSFGRDAADAVERARAQTGKLISTEPKNIVFTSGATESNNLAIKGVIRACRGGKPLHMVTNSVEHRAVLDPARRLERQGLKLTVVPVDSIGRVDPAEIEASIGPETVLVSVMWVNNEIGTLQPIAKLGEICRQKGVLFHVDAAQAVGKVSIDLSTTSVDLLSLSAHKIYGPKGVGALFVRPGSPRVRVEPLFDGGGQEQRLRSGTLPVPLIVGLGAACEIAASQISIDDERIRILTMRLQSRLSQSLDGLRWNGPQISDPTARVAGNLNVSFNDLDGTALLSQITEVAVSSGSACTTADPEPSHVLRGIGVPDDLSLASLRFGIGRSTTESEIDQAADHIISVVQRLRSVRKMIRSGC